MFKNWCGRGAFSTFKQWYKHHKTCFGCAIAAKEQGETIG